MSVLKGFFIFLSKQDWLENVFKNTPGLRRLYKRFVAGDSLDDGLEAVNELNEKGMDVTLDHLGEGITEKRDAYNATRHYKKVLRKLSEINEENGMNNSISVKLTQIGLVIDKDYCLENAKKIIERAKEEDIRIEIDMEKFEYVQDTLDIYEELKKEYDKVAVCVQSYLYRTMNDVKELEDVEPSLRLVKGAYKESENVAFSEKEDVDKNFKKLMDYMIESDKIFPLIATHDGDMIQDITKKTFYGDLDPDEYEFEMLYGIRRELQRKLADEKFNVRIYTPYGEEWYPYFMRRLGERPANAFFVLKSLFKG